MPFGESAFAREFEQSPEKTNPFVTMNFDSRDFKRLYAEWHREKLASLPPAARKMADLTDPEKFKFYLLNPDKLTEQLELIEQNRGTDIIEALNAKDFKTWYESRGKGQKSQSAAA